MWYKYSFLAALAMICLGAWDAVTEKIGTDHTPIAFFLTGIMILIIITKPENAQHQ